MNSNGNNRYNRPNGNAGSGRRKPAGSGRITDRRTDAGSAPKPGTGLVRQYSSDGKRIERFNVHISEEDFENEITYDSKRGQRDKRLAEQKRGSSVKKLDETAIARRDVPISRTRVITSKSGERYEIPEESSLSPKVLRKIKKNQKSRGCVVSVVYAAIICSISALLAFYAVVGINDMFGLVKDDVDIIVKVPSESDLNLDTITTILDENDVVDYPFFFKLYAGITNKDAKYRYGTFTINRRSDYDMIIRSLTHDPDTGTVVRVTIPEGKNLMQIAEILEKNSVCETDAFYKTLEERNWKHDFFPDVPLADNSYNRDRLTKLKESANEAQQSFNNAEEAVNKASEEKSSLEKQLSDINEALKDAGDNKADLEEQRKNKENAVKAADRNLSDLKKQRDEAKIKLDQANKLARDDRVKSDRLYTLEGYLFPATYDFVIDEGPVRAINRMLNAFDSNVTNNRSLNFNSKLNNVKGRYSGQVNYNIDMDFIITMASVIEREAQDPEDMKKVASVFYNRLKNNDGEGIGGRLQSDATLWYPYATKGTMESALSKEQAQNFSSKYSTLNKAGLPPGPICCPGLNSISAALEPADTSYLYFFSDKDGKFHYATNYNDFQKEWAKYS